MIAQLLFLLVQITAAQPTVTVVAPAEIAVAMPAASATAAPASSATAAPASSATAAPANSTSAAPAAPLMATDVVQRYSDALQRIKEPRAMTFDYTLEQTGMRTLAQTHRVFRSGSEERDETITVDGKRLTPPKVRIFHGRRNRYAIAAIAPRAADYTFALRGVRKNGHHIDYIFRLTPRASRRFAITEVTIDGVRFLPSSLTFATTPDAGNGTLTFARSGSWWIPYLATARATVLNGVAVEKLSFYTYRFPAVLPPTTFGPLHKPKPVATTAPADARVSPRPLVPRALPAQAPPNAVRPTRP